MSISEIDRFAADLKSDEALRAEASKTQAAKSHAMSEHIVGFAASKGYLFTAAELTEHGKATAKIAGRELSDAELGGIVGGVIPDYDRAASDIMNVMTLFSQISSSGRDAARADRQAASSQMQPPDADAMTQAANLTISSGLTTAAVTSTAASMGIGSSKQGK